MIGRAATLAVAAAALALSSAAQAAPPPGFQTCAACHLPSGKGVPGAFPPLAGRIAPLGASGDGRNYLVQVLGVGVSGEMAVGSTTYRGFMPRQQNLSAADMADVLNYLAKELGDGSTATFKPFTADEVERLRAASPNLTPSDVAKLRVKALAGERN